MESEGNEKKETQALLIGSVSRDLLERLEAEARDQRPAVSRNAWIVFLLEEGLRARDEARGKEAA